MANGAAARSPTATLPSHRPIVLLLIGCVLYAGWIGTQYVAYRLSYQRNLGPWLYVANGSHTMVWRAITVGLVGIGLVTVVSATRWRWSPAIAVTCLGAATIALTISVGPVYAPYRGLVWAFHYEHITSVNMITRNGLIVSGAVLVLALVLSFISRPARQRRAPSTSHGSALWGTGSELTNPVHGGPGVLVGRLLDPPTRRNAVSSLRYSGDGHLLTLGPTRSGKGVSVLIPNLLTYPGSVVVTDPKGENYTVTWRRREQMGHEIVALDPFAITDAPSRCFNPLDMIDPNGPDVSDDAMLLADMLILPGAAVGEAAFWDNEARALIAGLILYVAVKEDRTSGTRTLPQVRRLLTAPESEFAKLLEAMQKCAHDRTPAGQLIARAATRHLQKADKERSGVISTAQSHTHFLDSPRMVQILQSSGGGLLLDRLKTDRISLYLILPAERLSTYQRWLRLMIGCGLLAMVRTRAQPADRVLFLLDEFANLGRLRPVEDAISLVGGYGASFWLFIQDLAQLKDTYRDRWETFEANLQVLQAIAVNDLFTAKHLSERLGEETIYVESENLSTGVSHGRHGSRQQSAAQTTAEKGRRLLTADEILRLPHDEQLLFIRGVAPIRARKLNYLRDIEFTGLADENPMYRPASPHSITSMAVSVR